MGASDAPKFTQAVEEMTQRAMKLGPNPLRKDYKDLEWESPSDEEGKKEAS